MYETQLRNFWKGKNPLENFSVFLIISLDQESNIANKVIIENHISLFMDSLEYLERFMEFLRYIFHNNKAYIYLSAFIWRKFRLYIGWAEVFISAAWRYQVLGIRYRQCHKQRYLYGLLTWHRLILVCTGPFRYLLNFACWLDTILKK